MIIGLVLCGLIAVLLFFGVAERVFKNFGVAYMLAFVMVGVLIGCAFIPSFSIGGVSVNVAGFIAPVVFAAIFFFIARRTREVWRSLVTMTSVAALYIATELLIGQVTSETVTVIVAGFLCGACAFLVGKTELAGLAAVFAGFPLGEVIASIVSYFAYGTPIRLGSAAAFDGVIIAAVFSVALYEAIAAIKRTMNARTHRELSAETAKEFDPDEYKKYFDE